MCHADCWTWRGERAPWKKNLIWKYLNIIKLIQFVKQSIIDSFKNNIETADRFERRSLRLTDCNADHSATQSIYLWESLIYL